jgi:hypothetical protein
MDRERTTGVVRINEMRLDLAFGGLLALVLLAALYVAIFL